MEEKTRYKTTSNAGAVGTDFSDYELDATRSEFLKAEKKDSGKSLFNIASISGLALLFMVLTYVIHDLGLPVGDFLEGLSSFVINVFPILGGVLVSFVALGYLVGDKRRERKLKKQAKKQKKLSELSFTREEKETKKRVSKLQNDLEQEAEEFKSTSFRSRIITDTAKNLENKKLWKSRTDKKLTGVCGGLAEYFGISSAVVRLIFFISFFMYGTSILIYIALALVMPQKPADFVHELEF